MFESILLILGVIGLWIGSGLVINAAQRIAKSLNISGAFIGLTIISIGSSLPEIITHIISSIDILKGIDASGVSVGTNVGSNLIQITFILGIVGLLLGVKSHKTILHRDYTVMMGSIVLLFIFSIGGTISRIEGIILVLLYIIYIGYLAKKEKLLEKNPFQTDYIKDTLIICSGIALLIFSADLVVDEALLLSSEWGLATSFIGTLIIGVGTALPELSTALRGILKKAEGISLGTLVGSNITNPLLALGLGAAISGYTVDKYLFWYDIPVWFLVSLIVMLFFWKNKRLSRVEAMMLIALYFLYVVFKLRYLHSFLL
ncbi:MAG: sodium:calcium antiporter [Candidatus Woesearchaeota archaeon]